MIFKVQNYTLCLKQKTPLETIYYNFDSSELIRLCIRSEVGVRTKLGTNGKLFMRRIFAISNNLCFNIKS